MIFQTNQIQPRKLIAEYTNTEIDNALEKTYFIVASYSQLEPQLHFFTHFIGRLLAGCSYLLAREFYLHRCIFAQYCET